MAVARMGRFNSQLTYGFLHALRTNPLNTSYQRLVRPPQDQRHTFSIAADFQLHAHWRVTARYAFHPGRPVAEVEVVPSELGRTAIATGAATVVLDGILSSPLSWRRKEVA